MDAVQRPIALTGGEQVTVDCSIGVAPGAASGGTGQEILAAVDAAMCKVKLGGAGASGRRCPGHHALYQSAGWARP